MADNAQGILTTIQNATSVSAKSVPWVDWIRGYAVLSIIFHHWLYFLGSSGNRVFDKLIDLTGTFTGNSIHLFFVASGFGLMYSHLIRPVPWRTWFSRRLWKILVPFWIMTGLTWVVVNVAHYFFQGYVPKALSLTSLLHNIFLTRNFDRDATIFNLSLWFIPNIVGLYVMFPSLSFLFKKINNHFFLLITFSISMVSILVYVLAGRDTGNLHSIFPFFLFEFSFGMYLAYLQVRKGDIIQRKNILLYCGFGLFFYVVSYILSEKISWGSGFNKPFTALGIFPLFMVIINLVRKIALKMDPFFSSVSRASYYMYLLHFPVYFYFLQPCKTFFPKNYLMNLGWFLATYLIFAGCMYLISSCLIKMEKAT